LYVRENYPSVGFAAGSPDKGSSTSAPTPTSLRRGELDKHTDADLPLMREVPNAVRRRERKNAAASA
jgi:hypothetical protein